MALAPPLGLAMMGYGARVGVAEGEHDPLEARALYLAAEGEWLLVEADLCLLSVVQCRELRERIARRTGIPPAGVTIACIHTHSGPDTGLMEALAGRPRSDTVCALEAAIEAAALEAHARAAPARLGLARSEAGIGRNRRVAEGPVDPTVWVARIDSDSERGRPLAVLFLHGCHPTVLGHENLLYSADWPWAARRRVEGALPGTLALFALSAHADVDPRTRGLLDLADEEQSRGAGFDEAEALGVEVGEAVARAAAEAHPESDAPLAAATASIELPVHGAEHGEAEHARHLETLRVEACEALGLDPGRPWRTAELFRVASERVRGLAPEEARERLARARLYLRDRTAVFFAGGLRPRVEVQLVRLGALSLLALPAEPTVKVGEAWRTALGGEPGAVLSLAGGWLRYLPHPEDFAAPGAERAYEVLMSTFVPDAALRLVELGLELRDRRPRG